jgi:2-polyprenyl-3-methyl-5-hydroxy-6-metoxy-1,4-benzoquinol methylase
MADEQERYIAMYRKLHQNPTRFLGGSTAKHADDIADLVMETSAKTLLDFGCGKGGQYADHQVHKVWGGIMPVLYDPGVPSHMDLPCGVWDGVLCIDVLEHVPECAVLDVLDDVISRASRFVFANISTRVAGVRLPNGENAHCTVREHDWWVDRVTRAKESLGSDAIVVVETRKSECDIEKVRL